MAKLNGLPKALRDVASRFRYLDSMPTEEARCRAAHIYDIEQRCPMTGEAQQLMLAHTGRLAAALPVGDYLRQLAHLNDLAQQAPGTGLDSPAHDFRAAAVKLKGENVYMPGLVAACERWLVGREPMFDQADIPAIMGGTEETT